MENELPKQAIKAMRAAPALVVSTELAHTEVSLLLAIIYAPGRSWEDATRPRQIRLSELVRLSKLSRSTCKRSVTSLRERGFIRCDSAPGMVSKYSVWIDVNGSSFDPNRVHGEPTNRVHGEPSTGSTVNLSGFTVNPGVVHGEPTFKESSRISQGEGKDGGAAAGGYEAQHTSPGATIPPFQLEPSTPQEPAPSKPVRVRVRDLPAVEDENGNLPHERPEHIDYWGTELEYVPEEEVSDDGDGSRAESSDGNHDAGASPRSEGAARSDRIGLDNPIGGSSGGGAVGSVDHSVGGSGDGLARPAGGEGVEDRAGAEARLVVDGWGASRPECVDDEEDRPSGDGRGAREADGATRTAGWGGGDDAERARPDRPGGPTAQRESRDAGEASRADALGPDEWVDRIKAACSGPVGVDTSAPPEWAPLTEYIHHEAGPGSMRLVRDLRGWLTAPSAALKAQGLNTPEQRCPAFAAAYQWHIENGTTDPKAVWVVERACKIEKAKRDAAPKMRVLTSSGHEPHIRTPHRPELWAELEESK